MADKSLPSRRAKPKAHGHRLLVVEDDSEMRSLLVEALSGEGRVVRAAADGGQALQLLEKEPPFEVVISDIKMPAIDGHGVLRKVVQDYPKTKVILITAFGELEEYLGVMNRGAFEYLNKPFKMMDLCRIVNRALI